MKDDEDLSIFSSYDTKEKAWQDLRRRIEIAKEKDELAWILKKSEEEDGANVYVPFIERNNIN